MYPAANQSIQSILLVSLLFGAATIATMMGIVVAGCFDFSFMPMKRVERYAHALAGGTLCLCGLAMLLGL